MEFANPQFLWLMLLVPLALLLGLQTERFAMRVRRIFTPGPKKDLHRWRSLSRILTAIFALMCLVIALAGPRVWALLPGDVREGLVLAVGIDVSKSMLAEDVVGDNFTSDKNLQSSRLNAASQLAVRIFDELDGEKAGLFLFARNGIEVVSPTRDQGFLRYMAQHTDLAQLTESGSNLSAAMQTGADMIGAGASPGAVILISDGEDTENQLPELMDTAETLSAMNVPVYTVGVGHAKNVYIPIRRSGLPGIQDFYQDNQGNYLKTRLEERSLREISAATGGNYWNMEELYANSPGRTLLDQISSLIGSQPGKTPKEKRQLDFAPFFLGFGLLLYVGYMIL